ncbi:MAG: hypothetical protein IPM46_08195 [Flavobacteriales bacterium]|nr:hypothetical protein [Flavobacteriales bacterium]
MGAFFTYASLEYNDRIPLNDYRSTLRSDAAGYYIYLPGLFHHGFKASSLTDSIIAKGGKGFEVDPNRDRIIIKYTYGTALFHLPFYLVAEAIEGFGQTDGWSRTHHRSIAVAGILYWCAGLFLLMLALRACWPSFLGPAALVIGGIAFGTNSFYYAFRSPGFSHSVSFFLAALALYALLIDTGGPWKPARRRLFILSNALLVCVRPVDGLLVVGNFGLLFLERPEQLRAWRTYIEQAVALLVLAAPQLMYWRFVHGTWLLDPYPEEGFTQWASPQYAPVLFAPRNGLFPNAPFLLLLPVALITLFQENRALGWLVLALFAVGLYSMASWRAWHFGCGYGLRPMVQYLPLLSIPLWIWSRRLHARRPRAFIVAFAVIALVCFVNYRAMLQFSSCYRWEEWDWTGFTGNLLEAFFGGNALP